MTESRKKIMMKDTMLYATANYVSQGIGMVNSFLLRFFMGPGGMGVWSMIQVVLGYGAHAGLGTMRALARDYPLLRGQKKFDQADLVKNSTMTFTLVMSAIPAVLLMGFVLLKFNSLEKTFLVGLFFLVGFLFVQRFYDFLITLLRSEKRFDVLSRQIVLNALGGLLITVVLVKPWHIYGLYAGTALVTGFLIFVVIHAKLYSFRLCWHQETIKNELKLGLPLAASGFLYTFLLGLDKLVLAKKLGFYEVGLYSIAMMVSNYIFSLPMTFSNVLFPNLLEHYGEHKEDPSKVMQYLEKPVFVLSILVPFLCALAFVFMPVLIGLFLKKFVAGLDCMKIYLLGSFFLLMGQFANNFLVTIDKYLRIVPVLAGAIAINFLLNSYFIVRGWGVEGVALGTSISFAFYGLLTYFLALCEVENRTWAIKRIGKDLLIFGSYFGLIFFTDQWVSSGPVFRVALHKALIFLAISAPYLIYLEKKEHLLKSIWDIVANKFSATKL